MKFYGQFDPPVDKVIYERYFKDISNCTSIECGAFDGITENCTKFFEENFNWRTINIEPLPHVYKLLKKNRPDSLNLNIALSNENKPKRIRVYDINNYGIYNTNASLSHLPKHQQLLENISSAYEEYQVECKTYKQVLFDLGIDKIDLFVLDVEGHEPEVIDGMIGSDILPKVFVIEHGHRDPSFFEEKIKCLNKKYKLDYTSFVNSFYVIDEQNNN